MAKYKTTQKGSSIWYYVLLVLFLAIGFGANDLYVKLTTVKPKTNGSLRESDPQYNLIKPLLLCSEGTSFYEYTPLKTKLQDYITPKLKEGSAQKISVYVRQLDTGLWTIINGSDQYSPASLIKVPMMLAYFKLAESNPEILNKKIIYSGSQDANTTEYFKPAKALVSGQSYSVESLIEYMIKYSDNNAYYLLLQNINANALVEAYTDLGINLPSDTTPGDADFMTVKSYSHFFRVLYNGTYLSREYSQKALDLMTDVNFPAGISSGLPASTTLASKFGERTETNSDGIPTYHELHDCGIVYGPNTYTICVMTKGSSFDDLSTIIKDVSRITYQSIMNKQSE